MINLNANAYYFRNEGRDLWLLSHVSFDNRRVYVTFRRLDDNLEETVSFHVLSDKQSLLPFTSVDEVRRR